MRCVILFRCINLSMSRAHLQALLRDTSEQNEGSEPQTQKNENKNARYVVAVIQNRAKEV